MLLSRETGGTLWALYARIAVLSTTKRIAGASHGVNLVCYPLFSCVKPLLQIYTLGCSTSTVFHFQLDETTGEVASSANYTADASITGSQSGGIFVAKAFELAVLVGRPGSDEVGGALSRVL